MIIEKVFSNVEEESEKLYSILLSEDEAVLFSEFQREFARKDYEGLTPAQQAHLKNKRDHAAEMLKTERNGIRKVIDKDLKEFPSQTEGRTKQSKGLFLGAATKAKRPRKEGYLGLKITYGEDESSRVWRKKGQSLESYKQDRIKQANSDLKNSWDKAKRHLRKQVIEDVDGLNKQYEGQSIPKHLTTKPTKKISKSKTALGVAGVTGAAIIGKKLLDKKKKENK